MMKEVDDKQPMEIDNDSESDSESSGDEEDYTPGVKWQQAHMDEYWGDDTVGYLFHSATDLASLSLRPMMGLPTIAGTKILNALKALPEQILKEPIRKKLQSMWSGVFDYKHSLAYLFLDAFKLAAKLILGRTNNVRCFVLFVNGTIVPIRNAEMELKTEMETSSALIRLYNSLIFYRKTFPFHRIQGDDISSSVCRIAGNVLHNLRWAYEHERMAWVAMNALIIDGYPLPGSNLADRRVVPLDSDNSKFYIWWTQRDAPGYITIVDCLAPPLLKSIEAEPELGKWSDIAKLDRLKLANGFCAKHRQDDSWFCEPVAIVSPTLDIRWLDIEPIPPLSKDD